MNVYNFSNMAPGQINGLLNGPRTTIGGFAAMVPAWRHLGETVDRPDRNPKLQRAMIWIRDSDHPGQPVSAAAETLKEAREALEAEYGDGNVFDLHDEEDATRPC